MATAEMDYVNRGGGGKFYNGYFADNADIPASIDFGFTPQVVYMRYRRTSGGTNDYVSTFDTGVNSSKKTFIYGTSGWASSPTFSLNDLNSGAPAISFSGTTMSITKSDVHSLRIVAVPETD